LGTPECTLDHMVQGVESPQLEARDEDEDEYEDECECDEGEDEGEDEDPGRFCVKAMVMGGVKDGSTNAVEGISMGIA
jgi:hypothetical protein